MVRKPKVFLFDEPLSNLDGFLRAQMRGEIAKLHARLGATMIYVTHDQVEAMTMGQRIAVMKEGVIQQVADPLTLYNSPGNLFVATFIGSPAMNLFSGTIVGEGPQLVFAAANGRAEAGAGEFKLRAHPAHASRLSSYVGKQLILGFRAEAIGIGPKENVF